MGKEDDSTTIAVYRSTKDALDQFKIHPNQSYDEVIQKLIEKIKEASA